MPTYDYVCQACGHAFERFQAMSDRVLRTCPKCAKRKLVRQVGAGAGLIFKGSGFYQTDYKSSGSKAPPSESKSDAAPSGGCGKPACGSGGGACASPDGGGAKKKKGS